MKSKLVAGVLLLVVGLLGVTGLGRRGDATVSAAPLPRICLWRVQKEGKDGKLTFKLGTLPACKSGTTVYQMAKGPAELKMKLANGSTPCDELATVGPDVFPAGSILEVEKGELLLRDIAGRPPRVGFFSGKFEIKGPGGNTDVRFSGLLEVILSISPNHTPFGTDQCGRQDRLEGWVTGKGVGKSKGFDLRALLIAKIDHRGTHYRLDEFSLDGVVAEHH